MSFDTLLIGLPKVLHNVLKAPEHLQYQLAFLSSVSPNEFRENILAIDCGLISRNCMQYSMVLLRPFRRRRLPLPTHHLTVKKSLMIARFVSPSLNQKQRILCGAVRLVATTSIGTALSSGQEAKQGKRFDVCIGKTAFHILLMTHLIDALSAVHHGRETRNHLSESRRLGKLTTRGT